MSTYSYARQCIGALLLGVAVSCTGTGDRAADRAPASVDSVVPSASSKVLGVDSVRPMRPGERGHVPAAPIQWNAEEVIGHLSGMGLEPGSMGAVSRSIFRVRGQRFHVMGGRAVVEAYFYGDANAVALDTDQLDTVLVAPRGGKVAWEMAPRLVIDNNMAAVVMTDDASLRAKIAIALHSQLHGRTWVP